MLNFSPSDLASHLESLIPTALNASSLRTKVIAILTSLRASRFADVESLAHDIFLEAWENQTPLTYQFIYHRAMNAYRAEKRYRSKCLDAGRSAPPPTLAEIHRVDALEKLLVRSHLSPEEIEVIHKTYYLSLTYDETAGRMSRSVVWVKETVHTALQKIRSSNRKESHYDNA